MAFLALAVIVGVSVFTDDSSAEGEPAGVTVSYVVNSMTYTDGTPATAGQTYTLKDLAAMGLSVSEGQTFKGWSVTYTDTEGTHTVEGTYAAGTAYAIPAGATSVTLKAVIDTTTYSVIIEEADGTSLVYKYSFKDAEGVTITGQQDGTKADAIKLPHDATITLPVIKSDEIRADGKVFVGWMSGETVVIEKGTPTMKVTADVTLTASYRADVVITFVVDGIQTYSHTVTSIVIPDAPSKDGYTFVGWMADDGKVISDVAAFIAGAMTDKTLEAQFEPVNHAVTFVVDGKTVMTQTVRHGELATEPAFIPAKEGFTFQAWDFDFSKAIVEDRTISAQFIETPAEKPTGLNDPMVQIAVIVMAFVLLMVIAIGVWKKDIIRAGMAKRLEGKGKQQ